MDIIYETSTEEKEYEVWRTNKFQIKVLKGSVDKFKEKLEKKGKLGDYKIPKEEWRARKTDFVQRRMKPIDCDCSGGDYEEARNGFLLKLFEVLSPE